jgi:hypothetical protein
VWGGVVVAPGVSYQLARRLSLVVQAGASLTLLSPEFYVRNLETLYRPPAFGARVAAGFEWAF